MKTLELAQIEHLNECNDIINEGRNFQKEQGFVQWTDNYPNIDTVREDIQRNRGYIINIENEIAGYVCIDFEGEPTYNSIQGNWQTQEPYAVIHRMAFRKAFRNTGLTQLVFRLIEDLCRSQAIWNIRVDTAFLNERVQHILEKNGFKRCGIIIFQGSERIAYDKILSK